MFKLSSTQAASVDKSRASSCEVKLTLDSAVSFVSEETFVWDKAHIPIIHIFWWS
ncbi:hypothetical protein Bca4012_035388 [Brassica carinata]